MNAEDAYILYRTRIYLFIFKRTHDRGLAEDMTQVVFMKLVDEENNGTGVTNMGRWLHTVARNLVVDHYRRHHELHLETLPPPSVCDPQPLRLPLDRLTTLQRTVITLRYVEGYTVTETAAMLHRSEVAVKGITHRAIVVLRKELP